MRLYHGTSFEAVESILKRGIKPRHVKNQGNWEKFPSKEGYVYMTNAYALYFAASAIKNCTNELKCAIFEIETDTLRQRRLAADEDFIGQVESRQQGITIAEATDRCIPLNYRHHWQLSLEKMGNCCYYGTIPTTSITRYSVINLSKNPGLAMLALDPKISILNYSIMSRTYTSLMKHIFDGTEVYDERDRFEIIPEIDSFQNLKFIKEITEGAKEYKNNLQEWRKKSIEVFEVNQIRV